MKKKKNEELQIVYRAPKEVIPYWRNPRDHTNTLEKLKKSIEKYGFIVPITIDSKKTIINGHGRFKASLAMGLKKIPTIEVKLTAREAKQIRLLDNVIQESTTWERNMFGMEIRELSDDVDFMQDFFSQDLSEFLDDGIGKHVKPVTEADIEKIGDYTGRFNDVMQGKSEKIIFMCPHCYKEFAMEKNVIKERYLNNDESTD